MTEKKALAVSGIKRFGLGIIILGAFLFLCAGDLGYWNAWLYLVSLAVAIFSLGAYLYARDPELLQKRLQSKENESAQKAYVLITAASFLATFGLCGLDHRFGWSRVPPVVAVIALLVMLAGYGLFVLTLLQNRYASKVIEIQNGQKVIDTGVYGVIRHPLYTAAIVMFTASPIALGSYYAVLPMLVYIIGIVLRIRNEEKVLCEGLEGYRAYMGRVRYRLIPFVW